MPPKGTPPCVEVNEAAVFATRAGAEWWASFRARFDGVGRIATLTVSIGGDRVAVACDDNDDADWLADHMREQGLPASAISVRRARRGPGAP